MASIEDSIRLAVREEFADLLGLPDEEEDCDDCAYCSHADFDAFVANIKELRNQIAELKAKVAEIEKRPYISINEPIPLAGFDHLMRPGLVSYNCTNR